MYIERILIDKFFNQKLKINTDTLNEYYKNVTLNK